jgi:D-hexose-6-phosphate mutarotase
MMKLIFLCFFITLSLALKIGPNHHQALISPSSDESNTVLIQSNVTNISSTNVEPNGNLEIYQELEDSAEIDVEDCETHYLRPNIDNYQSSSSSGPLTTTQTGIFEAVISNGPGPSGD